MVVLIALALIVGSAIFASPKLITISGVHLDLAGLTRIFIGEEWEGIAELQSDADEYPNGPPSHVTQELFKDDNPDTIGEVSEEVETVSIGVETWPSCIVALVSKSSARCSVKGPQPGDD